MEKQCCSRFVYYLILMLIIVVIIMIVVHHHQDKVKDYVHKAQPPLVAPLIVSFPFSGRASAVVVVGPGSV